MTTEHVGEHEAMAEVEKRTMRAVVRSAYGDTGVLRVDRVPVPTIDDDQVLVQVHASSVGPWDYHRMTGDPRLVRLTDGMRRPRNPILGQDLAGTVVAVGSAVTGLDVGDEVYGEINGGAFAEYVAVRTAPLVAKPRTIDFPGAAALPVAGLTALQGLRKAGVGQGTRVLVTGASGGVGTFAVQIAKAWGAEVTGVCSTKNLGMVQSLGADRVLDYTAGEYLHSGDDYDVIFDGVGDRRSMVYLRALRRGGKYVMVAGPKRKWVGPLVKNAWSSLLAPIVRRRAAWVLAASNHDDLTELARLVDDGAVRPVIEARYPLERVAEAIDRQATFHASGKKVIVVGRD